MKKAIVTIFISIICISIIYILCKCDSYDNYKNPINIEDIGISDSILDDIPDVPIDLIYTWVDQNDTERIKYQKMLLKTKDENLDARRYSENQELKYSIRSVQISKILRFYKS